MGKFSLAAKLPRIEFGRSLLYGSKSVGLTSKSKAFSQNKSIFIPGTSDHQVSQWAPIHACIWQGPDCIRKPHLLSRIYPNHRLLFVEYLDIKDAGLETFVYEAKTINKLTPLSTMTNLFKELSNAISDEPSPEETESVQSLLKYEIFPLLDGGNAAAGFDELAIGVPESEWYIADRPHLRESFERGEVAILAFSVKDIHEMQKLNNVFNMHRRLLSNAAKEISKVEGGFHKGKDADMHYRGKVKYLNRYAAHEWCPLGCHKKQNVRNTRLSHILQNIDYTTPSTNIKKLAHKSTKR
jgi:hypothetical protein